MNKEEELPREFQSLEPMQAYAQGLLVLAQVVKQIAKKAYEYSNTFNNTKIDGLLQIASKQDETLLQIINQLENKEQEENQEKNQEEQDDSMFDDFNGFFQKSDKEENDGIDDYDDDDDFSDFDDFLGSTNSQVEKPKSQIIKQKKR